MLMTRKYITIMTIVTILSLLLYGCGNSTTIKYNGNTYTSCNNPSIEDKDIKTIATKIGKVKGSDVYRINGEPESEWIYLSAESMSDSPIGLFKSNKTKVESIKSFMPNQLTVLKASSNNQKTIFDTKDKNILVKVVDSVENGKKIGSKKINIEFERNLEFRSTKFPNLVYRYDYIVSKDGKFYLSFNKDTFQVSADINSLVIQN
jgi:hypothetical protein